MQDIPVRSDGTTDGRRAAGGRVGGWVDCIPSVDAAAPRRRDGDLYASLNSTTGIHSRPLRPLRPPSCPSQSRRPSRASLLGFLVISVHQFHQHDDQASPALACSPQPPTLT